MTSAAQGTAIDQSDWRSIVRGGVIVGGITAVHHPTIDEHENQNRNCVCVKPRPVNVLVGIDEGAKGLERIIGNDRVGCEKKPDECE